MPEGLLLPEAEAEADPEAEETAVAASGYVSVGLHDMTGISYSTALPGRNSQRRRE